jgi:hypothetical protein
MWHLQSFVAEEFLFPGLQSLYRFCPLTFGRPDCPPDGDELSTIERECLRTLPAGIVSFAIGVLDTLLLQDIVASHGSRWTNHLNKTRSALDIDQLPRQAAEGNAAYFYFRFAGR